MVQSVLAQSNLKTYQNDPGERPREHSADITNMKVEVSFDCPKGIVKGKVTHTFIPLRKTIDTLFFDGPGIKISAATLDGKVCTFKTNSDGVTAYFSPSLNSNQTYNLTFEYEATPKRGIYFIGWNSPTMTDTKTQTRHQIWTQGQGIDNRHWIPMYDNMNDKFTTETLVTFDKNYGVLSNGALKSVKADANNTKTWHYSMGKPHAGYLLMLAIDKYAIKKTKTKSGVPVAFWYYPESPEKVEPTSIHTEKMIEFLEEETGIAYPWEAYSQVMVQDFMYGAMENTTATIFGDFFNVDNRAFLDRNYIGVNCHELTHQWFGDLITARGGGDTWLQESYATYYAKIFFELIEGKDKVKWMQRQEVNAALNASLTDNNPVRFAGAGTARVYQKGSTVIQMLRYVLGDEDFKKVIKYYLTNHLYKNVETNDLYQAVQDVTGQSLDWFFDEWLYRGGEPHYKVSYLSASNAVHITVEQIHAINELVKAFKMPINFAVYYKDGSVSRQQFWIEKQTQTVTIVNPSNKEILFVLFDENSEITKKVTFVKTNEELFAQLAGAANMIDRYDALLGLKNVSADIKRDALWKAFDKETFYGMKAEMVSQLANDPASYDKLNAQFDEVHVDITKSLVSAITKIHEPLKENFEKLLDHQSYELVERSLTRLCEEFPAEASTYLAKIEKNYISPKVYGQNNNIRIKYLELSILNHINETANISELKLLCTDLYEFRTRTSAMEAMKRLGICDESTLTNMLNAMLSSNGRLAGPAKSVIKYFSEQTVYKKLIEQTIRIGSYSDKDKKIFVEAGLYKN
ncbi:MAG: M1 family metallopeptidase [Bacteroidia bacterium]